MSEENILVATKSKDDEESQTSVSDGEIVDDDEVEDVKQNAINSSLRKLQKNFRTRQSESEDDLNSIGKKKP